MCSTFHLKMSIQAWFTQKPAWNYELVQLLFLEEVGDSIDLNYKEIIEKSDKFKVTFPIDNVRAKFIKGLENEVLENYFNSVCLLLHEKSLFLCAKFLVYKKQFGSESEKKVYAKIGLVNFLQRLIEKRAIYFDSNEEFLLMSGYSSFGKWKLIASDQETSKLNLQNSLSYNELELSSLLSISSYSYFINDGNKTNNGIIAQLRSHIEPEGVVIGIGNLQLDKPKIDRNIIVEKEENVKFSAIPPHHLFSDFYGERCWKYEEIREKNLPNLVEIETDMFFNNSIYCKRLALIFDTLLKEANRRAEEKKCYAYVHISDFRMGNWKIKSHQNSLILDVLFERIESLNVSISKITDINVSEINSENLNRQSFINIEGHPKQGIHIDFTNRNPFSSLPRKHEIKLLVVSFGWNGNSLPGNTFWKNNLTCNEAIIASASQISEIQNPHINPKVSVANLKIITSNEMVNFQEYCKRMRGDFKNVI